MVFEVHKKDRRGQADFCWLQANYSFSFANHYDPERMGFGDLLVLNDDVIAANKGFPTHPHQDMEIISIPLKGCLAHKDSTGAEDNTCQGEIQVMSAGTGMMHSEYNPSTTQETHSLQLWVKPRTRGVSPRYQKISYELVDNALTKVVSGEQEEGCAFIYQDANLYLGLLEKNKRLTHDVVSGFGVYLFVIKGRVEVLGETLSSKDAIAIREEDALTLHALDDATFLLIETK